MFRPGSFFVTNHFGGHLPNIALTFHSESGTIIAHNRHTFNTRILPCPGCDPYFPADGTWAFT